MLINLQACIFSKSPLGGHFHKIFIADIDTYSKANNLDFQKLIQVSGKFVGVNLFLWTNKSSKKLNKLIREEFFIVEHYFQSNGESQLRKD